MTQNNCSGGVGSICSWTARYVGPRTGATFQDLGPVAADRHGAPRRVSGQKALGVKVDVTKTPQTYLLGVMGKTTWTVNTTATAITGQPTGSPGGQLLPIAMIAPMPTAGGHDLRADQRLERAGQLRLAVVGRQQQRRAPLATSICTPNNPGVHTAVRSSRAIRARRNSSSVRAASSTGSTTSRPS